MLVKPCKTEDSVAFWCDDAGLWPLLPLARSLLGGMSGGVCLLLFHLLYSAGDQTLGLQPFLQALFAFKEKQVIMCVN